VIGCDDEGYATPSGEPIEFGAGQRDLAEEIVGSCPERAITLIDD
jgi:ferredoxin